MAYVNISSYEWMASDKLAYNMETGDIVPVPEEMEPEMSVGGFARVGQNDIWGSIFPPDGDPFVFHNKTKYPFNDLLFAEAEYIGPTQGRFRLYIDGELKDETVYERITSMGMLPWDQEDELDWFWQTSQRLADRRSRWPHLIREDPEKPKRGLLKGLFKSPDK